jgi:diguanylate cyclase (GGDEF)-like protein
MTTVKGPIAASNRPDPRVLGRLGTAETVCLAAAISIAATVLLGWLVPAVGLALPQGWSLMKANTALAVLLCSASLTLTRRTRSRRLVLASRACAGLVVLLAMAALFEHWTGRSTGLGTLLAADSGSPMPGRMAIQSASAFVLLGVSCIIDPTRQDRFGYVLDVANAALVLLNLVLIAGYIFGAGSLVGQSAGIRTSPQTLVCITLLTFVQTSRRAPYGLFSVLVGMGIGSQFARIMLPSSVLLSYLIIRAGERLFASGSLTLPYAAAVTASAMAALLHVLVLLLAGRINGLEAELRGMSLTDHLTGFHNRRGVYLLGEQTLRDARRAGRPLTVLFFDVDGLKKVNDELGHDVGSELLLDIAALLRETFRGSDVLGRVGGDEFVVVSHGHDAELTAALHRLDEATEAANHAGDRPYRISFSVGAVTTDPWSDESLATLLERADAAMYRKKRERRVAREAEGGARQVRAADPALPRG